MKTNNPIADFKVRNEGADIALIFLDQNSNEIERYNFSWVSAFRLVKEISSAVDFGFETLKEKIKKVK
jgi:hypothetical protein